MIVATIAALLTSATFGHVLTLSPLADDKWGLQALTALLRVGALALTLVRSEPPNLSTLARAAACEAACWIRAVLRFCRMLS